MTVKFAADVIETFDTAKTLGTLNFLEALNLMLVSVICSCFFYPS